MNICTLDFPELQTGTANCLLDILPKLSNTNLKLNKSHIYTQIFSLKTALSAVFPVSIHGDATLLFIQLKTFGLISDSFFLADPTPNLLPGSTGFTFEIDLEFYHLPSLHSTLV